MEKKLEKIGLQIAAHRVLLAGLLAKSIPLDDELALARLRAQILDAQTAANVRVRHPEVGDVFFEEMERILLMSAAAVDKLEQGN